MNKRGVTVFVYYPLYQHFTVPNQTVTDIEIDGDGYAYGKWNGYSVAAFTVDDDIWYCWR